MKILQIIAHPSTTSFTQSLSTEFALGAESAGHRVLTANPYDLRNRSVAHWQELVQKANHLCFAWPCLWELPPAKLVELFQTVFVHGFAFELIDGRMVPRLNIPTTCLISMGQIKGLNTENLSEAMQYCGLHPTFHIFNNVGPRLSGEMAELHLARARKAGFTAKGTNVPTPMSKS